MARYVLYLDEERIEVHVGWTGKCQLFVHGREVDSGTVYLGTLKLKDPSPAVTLP